jgi:ABC-type transport system involved in cytochrome bd biosynthesis fused ATPase/permease subunit
MPNIAKYILIISVLFLPTTVWASSTSAYQEYLQEFDKYRTVLNDFKVARSEYLKFKTLTSQQSALEKTKQMLADRSQLLRSYLQFLNEKLNESK